jgi:AcrR family transcriptional regulator
VRRDSAEARDELRRDALAAAHELFAQGGLDAVSMRGVAARVGVTPMALYRYFDGKPALLVGLWQSVLEGLAASLQAARRPGDSAELRVRASMRAFVGHWEAQPQHFRLVYASPGSSIMSRDPQLLSAPVYRELLADAQALTADFARGRGLPTTHVALARDLRHAMLVGYLHSRIVNVRYPWSDLDALREVVIESIPDAMARCLARPAP